MPNPPKLNDEQWKRVRNLIDQGLSLRGAAKYVKDMWGVTISHTALRNKYGSTTVRPPDQVVLARLELRVEQLVDKVDHLTSLVNRLARRLPPSI